jgi:4'-phosphopantetheinyl transferase EntD
MDRIVPDYVLVEEISGTKFSGILRKEEKVALGRVAKKRHQEFAIGRDCAHRGLARLGAPDIAILIGPNREPIWPEGHLGSITHCEGYCAAAVARANNVISIGIDAESMAPITDNIIDLIAFDDERRWVEGGAAAGRDKLIFSAKESVFKAWFPLTGTWLDFEDVRIFFDVGSETFTAHLLVDGPIVQGTRIQRFHGRYAYTDNLVFTAVVVSKEDW